MAKRSLIKILKNVGRAQEVLTAIKVTSQWLPLTQAYLGLKKLKYPFSFQTRQGQTLIINTFHDLITVWVIFFRNEYQVPQKTRVAVDAGANIGTFSIYAASKNVEKIYALEPFPETFKHLQKNIQLNNLQNKVELLPLALADQSGARNMDLSEGPSQSRGLLGKGDQQGLKVNTSSLADFIESTGKTQIDLLKIDIEGGEHLVFHSSDNTTLRTFRHIVMEYHPNASKQALFERIQGANFKLTHDFKISENSGVAYFARQ